MKYQPLTQEQSDAIVQRILEESHTELHGILNRIKHPHIKQKMRAELAATIGKLANALAILE